MPILSPTHNPSDIVAFAGKVAFVARSLSRFEARHVSEIIISGLPQTLTDYSLQKALPAQLSKEKREQIVGLISSAPATLSSESFALMLLAANSSAEQARSEETIELVLTGPAKYAVPMRNSEQVIVDMLKNAAKRVVLVSYAVYLPENIRNEILNAQARGVQLAVFVESEIYSSGARHNSIEALGRSILTLIPVYYWPSQKRSRDGSNKAASMHAKCAIADSRSLFVSSANLTEYAMTINLELGVLIAGGEKPALVEQYFDGLVAQGIFERYRGSGS